MKKEACKHLLAAFCSVGRNVDLLIGDLRPLLTVRRRGTQVPTRRGPGRPQIPAPGCLNDGERQRVRGRIIQRTAKLMNAQF
jgi:hypothetical protein